MGIREVGDHFYPRRYVLVYPDTDVQITPEGSDTPGVLGVIHEGNAYIRVYPSVKGRAVDTLRVGEWTIADYNLSGSKGTYKIVRVQ